MIVKNYLCNVLCKFLIKIKSMWRQEITEKKSQLTLLYCGRRASSSHWRCSTKKAVLKNLGLQACNFLKRRHQHKCFLWICYIFKTTYFKKHLWRAASWLFQWPNFLFLSQHLWSWIESWPAFENLRQITLKSHLKETQTISI